MPKRVLLVNDTTRWYHFGCTATSTALTRTIGSLGFELRTVPINDIYKLESIPQNIREFADKACFEKFIASNPSLARSLNEVDIIGIRPAPLGLLYIAYASKVFLGKNVQIINHSVYPQDDLSVDNEAIIALYKMVYSKLDFAAIREPLSFQLMQNLGVACVESFDCMPLYIKESYKLHGNKEAKLIYIAGSAVWLHLNMISSEKGEIAHFENGLSQFVQFMQQMQAKGFGIKFLYGAEDHPAKDDREFIDFVKEKFNFKLQVHEAKSLEEWLRCIESATIFVSGRFHHTIAAACLRTPYVLLVSNTPKVEGLAMVLGCESVLKYSDSGLSATLQAKCEAAATAVMPSILDPLCDMAQRNFAGIRRCL
jgi:polysaccharide pyruvyl transferase WcaK-like protein